LTQLDGWSSLKSGRKKEKRNSLPVILGDYDIRMKRSTPEKGNWKKKKKNEEGRVGRGGKETDFDSTEERLPKKRILLTRK